MGIGDWYAEDEREARNEARDRGERVVFAEEHLHPPINSIRISVSQHAVPGKVLPWPGEPDTYVADPATFQKLKAFLSTGL